MTARGNQGARWEATLEGWHAAYNAAGEAMVWKTPAPVSVMGPPKRDRRGRTTFPACWSAHGPPDFVGCVHGLGLVIEAKHTAQARLSLDAIKSHQAQDMSSALRTGAIVFVAVEYEVLDGFRSTYQRLAVPWSVLRPVWTAWAAGRQVGKRAAAGTASVTPAQLQELGALPMPPDGWLSLVSSIRRADLTMESR